MGVQSGHTSNQINYINGGPGGAAVVPDDSAKKEAAEKEAKAQTEKTNKEAKAKEAKEKAEKAQAAAEAEPANSEKQKAAKKAKEESDKAETEKRESESAYKTARKAAEVRNKVYEAQTMLYKNINGVMQTGKEITNGGTAGDPVIIASGTYLLNETDFNLKRTYTSGKSEQGIWGASWQSSSCVKLIRCITCGAEIYREAETLSEELVEYKETAEALKSEYDLAEKIKPLNKYTVSETSLNRNIYCGNERLILIDETGRANLFKYQGKGIWNSAQLHEYDWRIIKSIDGKNVSETDGFILEDKGGVKLHFNKWGLVEKKRIHKICMGKVYPK